MRNKYFGFLPVILILSGLALLTLYLFQPVTILMNGSPSIIRSPGLSVNAILRSAGIPLYAGDVVTPGLSSLLLGGRPVTIKSTSSIALWIDSQRIATYTTETIPANVLLEYGVKLFPRDTLTIDGKISSHLEAFQPARYHTIQVRKWLPENAADNPDTVAIHTVGSQLAKESRPLMGLDYSIPSEDQPSPNAEIQVARVADKILLEQKVLPFEYLTQANEEVELDQQIVTQTGEYGLSVDLTRIRTVNGQELFRETITSSTIRQPLDQILSYGTKPVIKTMDVGGKTIEYWRAVSLYATSYSPCRSGIDGCSFGTRSGAKAGYGIVAVVSRWYPTMGGQQVYIPGYGFAVIGDTGGGIPGTPWIDLGYDDDNYQSWSSWVTVYFLTPVPANILYILN
jgi:uncharacterized protein YabE (DUF348 family)